MLNMIGILSVVVPFIVAIICAYKITNDKSKSKKLKVHPLVMFIGLFIVFYGLFFLTIFLKLFLGKMTENLDDKLVCLSKDVWCQIEYSSKSEESLFRKAYLFRYLSSFYLSLYSSFVISTFVFCKNNKKRIISVVLETIILIALFALYFYYLGQIN